jgi:hypothetical protein
MRVGKTAPKDNSVSIPATGPSLLREADWRLPSGSTLAEFALQSGFLAFRLRDADARQGAVDCFPVWPRHIGYCAEFEGGEHDRAARVCGRTSPVAATAMGNGREDGGFEDSKFEDSSFTVPARMSQPHVQGPPAGQPDGSKVKTDR